MQRGVGRAEHRAGLVAIAVLDIDDRAIDPVAPATTSVKMVQEVIRGFIGFDGLLMSDDVSMNALSGTLAERSRAAIAAGCDVVLHCNGKLDEMRQVAGESPRSNSRSRQFRIIFGSGIFIGQTLSQRPQKVEAFGRWPAWSTPISEGVSTAPIGPG